MSERKTHYHHISISAGQYPSVDAALADVAAYLVWLKRTCTKHGYACICYAGVSEHHHDDGSIICGKRGKKKFIFSESQQSEIDPHIHILLYANPAETLSKKTLAYFKRRGKPKGYHQCCDDYLEVELPYIMKQSIKCRTTACNIDQFDDWDLERFLKIAELKNKQLHGCVPVFKNLSDAYFKEDFEIDLFTLWGLRLQGKPASLPTIKAVSVRPCRSTM